jgi:hypothetical protein
MEFLPIAPSLALLELIIVEFVNYELALLFSPLITFSFKDKQTVLCEELRRGVS